jgi:hypothetical protein
MWGEEGVNAAGGCAGAAGSRAHATGAAFALAATLAHAALATFRASTTASLSFSNKIFIVCLELMLYGACAMNASALAANVKLVWLSLLPGLPHWAGARAEERQLRPGVLMGPSTSLATVLRMERNWMLCWVRGGAKEWARARMICTRLSAPQGGWGWGDLMSTLQRRKLRERNTCHAQHTPQEKRIMETKYKHSTEKKHARNSRHKDAQEKHITLAQETHICIARTTPRKRQRRRNSIRTHGAKKHDAIRVIFVREARVTCTTCEV